MRAKLFVAKSLIPSPFFSRPARLFVLAFGTRSSRGYPLPPATQAIKNNASVSLGNNLVFLSFIIQGCTDWNSNPIDVSRIQYSSLISNSTREAALSLRGVLTPALFEGVMSYMVWWLCTAWLIASLFGVLYLKTFEAS